MPTSPRVTSVGDKALPSLAAALRVGPGPSLGNTVELAGMMGVWVWVSGPQGMSSTLFYLIHWVS